MDIKISTKHAELIIEELEKQWVQEPVRQLLGILIKAVNSRKENIMYKLESLNEFSKEAVACTVAFQRMGFDLSNVGAGVDGDAKAFVTLHHGGEQYNVVLGKLIDISPEIYVGKWREAILNISENQVKDVSIAELCHRSMIWDKMESVIAQLVKRGFLHV